MIKTAAAFFSIIQSWDIAQCMAVRVNLKTTFTVHKSSFCVRILLPLCSALLCSALLLLLIRFMGDKSAGAPKPLLPPAGSLLSLSQSRPRWEHTGELSKYTIATIINVCSERAEFSRVVSSGSTCVLFLSTLQSLLY